MSTILHRGHVPPEDNSLISIDSQAITSAASYPASVPSNTGNYASVDVGDVGGADKLAMYFIPSATLAGGTSLQFVLHASNDNSSFTAVRTTDAIVLASYDIVKIPLVPGYRYFQAQAVSLGVHTAGSVKAYVARDE